MSRIRASLVLPALLGICVLLAACEGAAPVASAPGVVVATVLEATPTAEPSSTPSPVPSPTASPSPTPTPTREPIELVVLHTNDNWGETEPCG